MIVQINAVIIPPHARIGNSPIAFPDARDLIVEAVFFDVINLALANDRGDIQNAVTCRVLNLEFSEDAILDADTAISAATRRDCISDGNKLRLWVWRPLKDRRRN